jgi:hypothetical protein
VSGRRRIIFSFVVLGFGLRASPGDELVSALSASLR